MWGENRNTPAQLKWPAKLLHDVGPLSPESPRNGTKTVMVLSSALRVTARKSGLDISSLDSDLHFFGYSPSALP